MSRGSAALVLVCLACHPATYAGQVDASAVYVVLPDSQLQRIRRALDHECDSLLAVKVRTDTTFVAYCRGRRR